MGKKIRSHNPKGLCDRIDISCFAYAVCVNFLLALFADGSLGGSQTGDGDTEGRAGNIVQTNPVAELHAHRVAAVLTADAAVE